MMSSSSSSEFGEWMVWERLARSDLAPVDSSELHGELARSLTRSTMGEVLGDNGEETTRTMEGTCLGMATGEDAQARRFVSARAPFLEEGRGEHVVVTPSAQLRVRRLMTTAVRRASGQGYRRMLSGGAVEAWSVVDDGWGGEATRNCEKERLSEG